jgi:hypothetical protein
VKAPRFKPGLITRFDCKGVDLWRAADVTGAVIAFALTPAKENKLSERRSLVSALPLTIAGRQVRWEKWRQVSERVGESEDGYEYKNEWRFHPTNLASVWASWRL